MVHENHLTQTNRLSHRDSQSSFESSTKTKPTRFLLWIVLIVLALVILAYFIFGWGTRDLSKDTVIAVLPFDALSYDDGNQAFISKLHREMTAKVRHIQELDTISVETSARFQDRRLTGQEIGNELKAAILITGEIQQFGNQSRIHVQLIDTRDDSHLWNVIYNRVLKSENSRLLQLEISATVARQICAHFNFDPPSNIEKVLSFSPEALEYYELGTKLLRSGIQGEMPQAIEYFEQAIALDPNFEQAYLGLGNSYLANLPMPLRDRVKGMKAAAEKILLLDESSAEAHVMLGRAMGWDGDRGKFKTLVDKALQLDPQCARAYSDMARWEYDKDLEPQDPEYEALWKRVIELERKAVELDPNNGYFRFRLAISLNNQNRTLEALEQARLTVERDPEYVTGYYYLGRLLTYQEHYEEAMLHLRKGLTLYPEDTSIAARIRDIYTALNDREQIIRWTERMIPTGGMHADTYQANLDWYRGEKEKALEAFRDYFRKPQREYPGTFRIRLLSDDLRNGKYSDTRARYYNLVLELFNADPTVTTQYHAVFAMDLAAILMNTGEEDKAKLLREKSWAFFQNHPAPEIRNIYEIFYLVLNGENQAALDVLHSAKPNGMQLRLYLEDAKLDPLRNEPRFQSILEAFESKMAGHLARIRQMEANGEFEPIPELPENLNAEASTPSSQ